MQCQYMFPCHPAEIIDSTPNTVTDVARYLRLSMITMIADLSRTFSQEELDEKIMIDLDENNNIIGMDLSHLIGLNNDAITGTKLGDLSEDDWINIKTFHI